LHIPSLVAEKKTGDSDENVAFVIFNVKGKNFMAIDRPNDFDADPPGEKERTFAEYANLSLSAEPFVNVKYYIPFSSNLFAKQSTYLPKKDVDMYGDAVRTIYNLKLGEYDGEEGV
jgi:hypothetical protein